MYQLYSHSIPSIETKSWNSPSNSWFVGVISHHIFHVLPINPIETTIWGFLQWGTPFIINLYTLW